MAALHRADTRMTAAAGQFLTTFRQFVTFRCPTQPRLRAASLTLAPRSTFSTSSSSSKTYYSSARPITSLTRLSLRQRQSLPRNRLVQHRSYLSVASAPSSDHVTSHDPSFPTSRTPNVLASNTASSTTAEHPRRKERVLLLMSGGVDSSMCAYILHNKGYDVTGLYMHNWNHQEETQDELPSPSSLLSLSPQGSPHQSSNDTHHLTESPSSTSTSSRTARIRPKVCTSDRDWADVQAVCSQLGIPARRLDFSREYWNQVFEVMLHEYERGRTPNPDVTCNKEIKFGELIEWCQRNGGLGKDRFVQDMSLSTTSDEHAIGWDYLATGHYARVELDPVTGHARLMRALDSNKDQTYYLSTLSERVLRHAIFPLAQYDKPTVKRMAMAEGTPLQVRNAAQKKESMGICFVGQRRRFGEFLKEYLDVKPGPVCVNGVGGQVIGEHKGLFRYTVGQASGVAHGSQKWVVLRMDMQSNTLVVVDGTQNERLFSEGLIAESWHWIAGAPPKRLLQLGGTDEFPFTAQIRHRQEPQQCAIEPIVDGTDIASTQLYRVRFKDRQRAIAAGQQIVLYDQDECLGGAIIQSSFSAHDMPHS